jgi:phage gp29-like protein
MSLVSRVRSYFRAAPPPPPPPPGEVAFADPRRLFPKGYSTPYNPSALVRGRGLRVFEEMRKDDQVKAALAFKKHTVIATGWTVSSPEGQPEDWEPTRFVRWVLENLDPTEIGSVTLDGDLFEILGALDFGFSLTEKLWTTIEYGPFAGQIGLKSLKTRAPHTFRFDQDAFGNLRDDGIIQDGNTVEAAGRLPRDKFVLFSYMSEFSNPYGTSDLEAAYFPWWIKNNSQKWLAMLLERLGIPPIFGLYSPNAYSTGTLVKDLKDIMTNLQAATFGIIPRPTKDALEFWAPELAGQATRVFIPSLEYLNQAIARALLMPGLLGMTADTSQGSFARARIHFDVFLLVIEKIRKDIEQVVMCHQVVRPLCELNYPGLTTYPLWRFMPLTDDLRLDLLDKWKDLTAQKVVTPQPEDEVYIRKLMKFPEKRAGEGPADGANGPDGAAAGGAATPYSFRRR